MSKLGAKRQFKALIKSTFHTKKNLCEANLNTFNEFHLNCNYKVKT